MPMSACCGLFGKLALAQRLHWQCVVAKHMLSHRRAIRQADIAADGLTRSCTSSCCRCRWVALQAQDTVHVPATSCLVLLNEELRETPEAARESCSLFGPMPHVSASTLLCRLCFLHVRGGSSSMLMHNVHRLTNIPVFAHGCCHTDTRVQR